MGQQVTLERTTTRIQSHPQPPASLSNTKCSGRVSDSDKAGGRQATEAAAPKPSSTPPWKPPPPDRPPHGRKLQDVSGELREASGNLRYASGELREASGKLRDASGRFRGLREARMWGGVGWAGNLSVVYKVLKRNPIKKSGELRDGSGRFRGLRDWRIWGGDPIVNK